MSKEKIGIVPGDMDKAAYEVMLRIFHDENMKDLIAPSIYGIKENAAQAMDRAMKDCEEGLLDAIVTGVRDITGGDMLLLVSEHARLALRGKLPLREHLEKLHLCMQRDFLISEVRIALVGIEADEEETKDIPVYGPYTEETLLEDNNWSHYDVILAKDAGCVSEIMARMQTTGMWYDADSENIVTTPTRTPHWDAEGKEMEDCQSVLAATFTATDINRNRETYDEANANPLPKLFMDRREERRNPVNFRVPIQ